MKQEDIIITAKDGYALAAVLREPETPLKGVVQIHCGTGIPQKLYAHFADFLTENGYATLTFDYRGIGKSKYVSLRGFKAKLQDWAQLDMTSVFDWVLNRFPNDKKIIVAHSMGGQLVGLMENNHRIDNLFLVASSTGYWRDMSKPYRWILPPLGFFLLIPLQVAFYGFVKAKKVRQGEDLPLGVGMQWRKWCINPKYFETDFGKSIKNLYYDQVRIPLKSIQISDDPIANNVTANKMLTYYKNATISIDRVTPKSLGVDKIGHTGFFSRRFKETLWVKLLGDINV
jgi:predicted alpha/beta hydrolase